MSQIEDNSQEIIEQRQPIFNIPGIIVGLAVLFIAIHLLRIYVLSEAQNLWVILVFSFIPASFSHLAEQLPVSFSYLWSPISHMFLHGDFGHLYVNILWMTAFGSPVAKRFGVWRFTILTAITAIGGAALHYIFHINEPVPVIGASGAVSGYMAAAARFAFQPKRSSYGKGFDASGPSLSLIESFKNKQFLAFLAVWMVINFVFGTGLLSIAGEEANIAWQAHIGGFIVGLFGFSLLDPKK